MLSLGRFFSHGVGGGCIFERNEASKQIEQQGSCWRHIRVVGAGGSGFNSGRAMIKTSRGGFTFFLFAVGFARAMESAQTRLAFHREKLTEMDVVIAEAIAEKRCPGGVLWIEHEGIRYHKAFGKRAVMPAEEDMTEDTIFDAASLTKVVA